MLLHFFMIDVWIWSWALLASFLSVFSTILLHWLWFEAPVRSYSGVQEEIPKMSSDPTSASFAPLPPLTMSNSFISVVNEEPESKCVSKTSSRGMSRIELPSMRMKSLTISSLIFLRTYTGSSSSWNTTKSMFANGSMFLKSFFKNFSILWANFFSTVIKISWIPYFCKYSNW